MPTLVSFNGLDCNKGGKDYNDSKACAENYKDCAGEDKIRRYGETNHSSIVNWMDQVLPDCGDENIDDGSSNNNKSADDSTLSSACLETALEEVRRQTQAQEVGNYRRELITTEAATRNNNINSDNMANSVFSGTLLESQKQMIEEEERENIHLSTGTEGANTIGKKAHRKFSPLKKLLSITDYQKAGRNEQLYHTMYREYVDSKIKNFQLKYPGELRDYRTMDQAEREREGKRVESLLQRLRIGQFGDDNENSRPCKTTNHEETPPSSLLQKNHVGSPRMDGPASSFEDDSFQSNAGDMASDDALQRSMLSNNKSIPLLTPTGENNNSMTRLSPTGENNNSMALLSPVGNINKSMALLSQTGDADVSIALLTPKEHKHENSTQESSSLTEQPIAPLSEKSMSIEIHSDAYSPASANKSVRFSTQSIEVARSCHTGHYATSPKSPLLMMSSNNQKKRLASTSGKRGMGTARLRKDDSESTTSQRLPPMEGSPSCILETSIRQFSVTDDNSFNLSQSPILHDDACSLASSLSSSDGRDRKSKNRSSLVPDISFGEENTDTRFNDSLDDTMMQERRIHQDLREVPANLKMKNASAFHYKPLQTESCPIMGQTSSRKAFPDPFKTYTGPLGKRLHRLYEWLRRRDDKKTPGIVLSMTQMQINDLVLKLLLESPHTQDPLRISSAGIFKEVGDINGRTLIVARTKEDLEAWGRAFREGSPFSVLNHITLPAKERKTPSTAQKCSKYDVVLTTFDGLKALDTTFALDDNGHVLTHKVGVADGWYSSRSGSQATGVQQCKQLSVLHCICWQRVVFVDQIGRKCFLAKPETARSLAAQALHAESRFAFFTLPKDIEGSTLSLLIKSDRKALFSVASVLRLEHDISQENLIQRTIVDLNEPKRVKL